MSLRLSSASRILFSVAMGMGFLAQRKVMWRGKKFLGVFAEQVGFQVYGIRDLPFTQRRHLVGVGNNPDAKTALGDGGDGEADAVHRDGAFEDGVAHHLRRSGNLENAILAGALPANDRAGAVDVSGDEVAAEAPVGGQRSFEVDQRSGAGEPQIRALPRFAQQIEMNQFVLGAGRRIHNREATAVHRHAVALPQSARAHVRAQDQANGVGRFPDIFNDAGFFDDAGEHQRDVAAGAWRVASGFTGWERQKLPLNRGVTSTLRPETGEVRGASTRPRRSNSGPTRLHWAWRSARTSLSRPLPLPATAFRASRSPRIFGA